MAVRDKFAGDKAINDNTIDPFIELAVLEAVDRVGEEADEDTIDKIARSEAVHDNTAGERVGELTVDPPIEAIQAADRVSEEAIEIIAIDPVTETIIDKIAEEVAEFLVEQPIEAIQAAERIDKEAVGPRFESSPH